MILQRAQIPDESPDERLTLNAVEADLPEDTAPTDERDATEEVAFANAAVADAAAQSLRLEIRVNGPCWVSAVADGERVVYRLMQPGERTLVEARGADHASCRRRRRRRLFDQWSNGPTTRQERRSSHGPHHQ